MDFDPSKVISSPFAIGVIGAAVGLKFVPGLSLTEKITNVMSGAACSGFVAPAVGELLHFTSGTMLGFMAFLIGLFGMSLAAATIQGVRDLKLSEIISGWISRR